ncbi:MAG: hypothetical protein ACNA7L_09645 [Roseinatronobacter sp.]
MRKSCAKRRGCERADEYGFFHFNLSVVAALAAVCPGFSREWLVSCNIPLDTTKDVSRFLKAGQVKNCSQPAKQGKRCFVGRIAEFCPANGRIARQAGAKCALCRR